MTAGAPLGLTIGVVLALASPDVASRPAGLLATTGPHPPIVVASESEAWRAASTVNVDGPKLFFGFLEFDHDPDAPGGVPGFGPLSSPPPQFASVETSR